jgi:hypothetical protein
MPAVAAAAVIMAAAEDKVTMMEAPVAVVVQVSATP